MKNTRPRNGKGKLVISVFVCLLSLKAIISELWLNQLKDRFVVKMGCVANPLRVTSTSFRLLAKRGVSPAIAPRDFGEMPAAAIATGCLNGVLPLDKIVRQLPI